MSACVFTKDRRHMNTCEEHNDHTWIHKAFNIMMCLLTLKHAHKWLLCESLKCCNANYLASCECSALNVNGIECRHLHSYESTTLNLFTQELINWIFVTFFAKTVLSGTLSISRNTILKHWSHCSSLVLCFS